MMALITIGFSMAAALSKLEVTDVWRAFAERRTERSE